MLKRTVSVIVSLVALVAIVATAMRHSQQSQGGVQGLQCISSQFDFGAINKAGARNLSCAFLVRNTTNRPWRILRTTSTCGCTVAQLPTGSIAAGAQTEVRVKADWSQRAGAQQESIALSTDNPDTQTILLTVKGNVTVPAAVSPATVNFGPLHFGEVGVRTIEVSTATEILPSSRPLRIIGIKTSDPFISVNRISGNEDESKLLLGLPGRFELKLTAPAVAEFYSSSVTFQTNLPEMPNLVVAIQALVSGHLRATPQSILFIAGAGTDPPEQRLVIAYDQAETRPSLDIIWDGPQTCPFSCRADAGGKQSNASEYKVIVSFHPKGTSEGLSRAKLIVSNGKDTLNIPLLALAAERRP